MINEVGYTGITTDGAGFTGSVPVEGAGEAEPSYTVIAGRTESITFADNEGEAFVARQREELIDLISVPVRVSEQRETVIYADRRSEAEIRESKFRSDLIQRIHAEYPWFDGTPMAWTWLEMTNASLSSAASSDTLDGAKELLETRERNSRSPYEDFLAPKGNYYQRPPRLIRR